MRRFTKTNDVRVFAIGGLTALSIAACASSVFAADIALRARATPAGTVVRLGDVADVRAESHREMERLAALPLMPAPTTGRRRFLRMREVQDLLAAHGEDMNRLNFQGETVIEVASLAALDESKGDGPASARERRRDAWLGRSTAAATPVAIRLSDAQADDLRAKLSRVIIEHLIQRSGQDGTWQVEFQVSNRNLASLPRTASELTCDGGNPPWTGKQRFTVSFATASGRKQFAVLADVTRPQPVVVAIRAIERGAVVTAADVELQQRDNVPTASGRRIPIDSVESLLGMEAARPIQVGRVILSDDVRAPLLVKRNEEVTVYARGGGIQVRSSARARQDGARGELVQVESLETRQPYDAVVVGFRELVVFAGNTVPTADVAARPGQPLAK